MAPISPGKMSGPPRRPKKPTATTKAHRFEGFNRRIGKIKIDPVHTVQKSRVTEDSNDLSSSHFRTALDEWSELNLSATFTSFLNKVQPLSESLPQLLHHAERIFSLLQEHIEKKDPLALEPLLSLVAHLAHDLGASFEKYFSDLVQQVARISASVEDPALIEYCFTCLAWMYKYLSRLLVQDLRPVFEIMVPYFSSKKEYVRRFTAESLAFLLRKAATMYNKKTSPLDNAIIYLFDQLQERDGAELESFKNALMTLLCETAIGVDAQLHSSAADFFKCIFEILGPRALNQPHNLEVLDGTVIHLIHSTDANGFRPVLQLIIATANVAGQADTNHKTMSARLLLDAIATRKGSRISDWKPVLEALLTLLRSQNPNAATGSEQTSLLMTIASISMQYCPMDQLLPFANPIVDSVTSIASTTEFFTFCEIMSRLGRPRFHDLLLPRLKQYITLHWSTAEDEICYTIQQLKDNEIVCSKPGSAGYMAWNKEWEKHVLQRLILSSESTVFNEDHAKYFQLLKGLDLPKGDVDRKALLTAIESVLLSSLSKHDLAIDARHRLSVGWAFKVYLNLSMLGSQSVPAELLTSVLNCRPEFYQLVPYLECCIEVLARAKGVDMKIQGIDSAITALCENLLSSSLELRKASLNMLLAISNTCDLRWLTETCYILLELVETTYTPSNARQLAMLIRRLAPQQQHCDQSSVLRQLIPYYGLGALQFFHDQARKEMCQALGRVAIEGKAEDLILDKAVKWLQRDGLLEAPAKPQTEEEKPHKLSPFECSNYLAIMKLSNGVSQGLSAATANLKQVFEKAHQLYPARTPTESRTLALQIFLEIPEVAERRSRALSPVFLSVQQGMSNHHIPPSDESTSSHTISPDFSDQPWTLKERKLFLELMGKFNNPRVLYRSRELYDYLLELLANGNSEMRKLALLALLNWKDQSLPKYKDILLRVAEETNATTELALLLAEDEEIGSIQTFDRPHVLLILLRLVFGQLIGRTGTHGSQEAKRKSILRLLFRMQEAEINAFLGIALGGLADISFRNQTNLLHTLLDRDIISQDQQYGFLRMMVTIQDVLQSQYGVYGAKVVDAVLYCTARACHLINKAVTDDSTSSSATSMTRNIRRLGIQCLTTIFEQCPAIDWTHYLPIIFGVIVNPRITNFTTEFTQGISGLLRLFSVWTRSHSLVRLFEYNKQVTESLWKIIAVPIARDDVKIYIMEQVLMPFLGLAADNDLVSNTAASLLRVDVESLLQSIASLLQRQPPKDVLMATTKIIPPLAPFTVSSSSSNEVLNLLISLLCEPAQRIPPHVKGQLLSATESLLKIHQEDIAENTKFRLYEVAAGLFNYFKDRPNRVVLGNLLAVLAAGDQQMETAVNVCQGLNAVSEKDLGDIDYERQLSAYSTINSMPIESHADKQWLPILNNLLYFARTADDFAIRSNAVSSLKRYIVEAGPIDSTNTQDTIRSLLLPALRKGVKEDSELVRADFVVMYGLVIKHLANAPELEDMKVLLVGDDEEASFFTNILHIQQHRRLRAMRRLLTEVEQGVLKSSNISDFFLPLLEKFIDDQSPDDSAQGMKGQSIVATSTILQWIDWKSFRTTFRQYKSDLDSGARPEKESIRLLSNAADALTAAIRKGYDEDMGTEARPYLSTTLPKMEIIGTELKTNFIPRLAKFIHHKDEAEISLRIPAAKVAVKLIKLLPSEDLPSLVAPIILDISQILRSRTQESRDIARNTLAEIVTLLGSSSVGFVLKQMRTTLLRGYQLHVLSYAMHTILLQSAESRGPGDLDYCLEDMAAVIMDDIFGVVGQEKENQDYISSMKEVKSSKSQDSMELLAKSASVESMSKLIRPFQTLLAGNLTTKQIHRVDELFRRVGVGISHNPAASSQRLLVFAYELIQAFYQQKQGLPEKVMTNDERNRQRYIVQLKSASETSTATSSSLQYKVVRFALDLVRSTLAKHTTMLTAENVHGFLPVIGDSLIEAQEDVRNSAFRLLSIIIKLPLAELDKNSSLYVVEAVKVVKGSISTNEEACQAAMKLVTAILRERRGVEVRDSDIAYLLHRTMPDIEEPDRQGVTFNFIKAVMARQYQLPEVYELMEKISTMMIRNQTRSARDMARGVFVHFLLEYPQSKSRWSKQLRFLVKNLEYDNKEGRQSVMEAVHILLQKLRNEALEEVASTFFIPMVLRMANDDDPSCREMAGALLAQIFRVSEEGETVDWLEPLRSWLDQKDNLALTKVSMQAWGIYLEVGSDGAAVEAPAIRKAIADILQNPDIAETEPELQYQALELFAKLIAFYPGMVMTQAQSSIWTAVRQLLRSSHAWVQTLASKLIGLFFDNCDSDVKDVRSPLICRHGLKFDAKATVGLLKDSVKIIRRNTGNTGLSQTTLRNLHFLANLVEVTKLSCKVKKTATTNDGGKLAEEDVLDEQISDGLSDDEYTASTTIPAIQYLLDQLTFVLRREPSKLTTAAFMPRISALGLLTSIVPGLSSESLSHSSITSLLVPLTHITDPSLQQPRSADPTFAATYQSYTESAHELQETIHHKLGDAAYVKLMTEVSKIVRERRGERRMKRAIDRVAEPERAEREKTRKKNIKARRKKAVVDIHRKNRRSDLGF